MSKLNWVEKGCAALILCAATAIVLPAQTFTTLHSFDSTDGGYPDAALVQATNGSLYGITLGFGANGGGTVFKITPSGTLTTLYNFCAESDCRDGGRSSAALVQASNGDLYGTTVGGGAYTYGSVFKMTPSGTLTTIYSFCRQDGGTCPDGFSPAAGLVQAADGNFYGTTAGGGAHEVGTVFKITPTGTLTTLYSFCSQSLCTDGNSPYVGLTQGTDGNFYGTTGGGGAQDDGTVFKITPTGTLTTLYSFCSQSGCTDGKGPSALVQASDGSFYGTASEGGTSSACFTGCGTVFKITASGTLRTLHSFDYTDGAFPAAAPIQASDGNFYGTTSEGGANNSSLCANAGCGTIFKITPSGTLTTFHSFCSQSGCVDGASPVAALVQDTNGKFYGTTQGGGTSTSCGGYTCGTVFSLSVGLGPFVESQPTSGKVGAAVQILGTNLTGSTIVTFNGTAATFKVVSSSLITTTVPAGATSGKIKVTTPTRTLSSNVSFRVLP